MTPSTDTKSRTARLTLSEPQLKILVVENNQDDAKLIERLITESGSKFAVTIAAGLGDVFELTRINIYDAILLDLSMPQSSELDTFLKVKSLKINSPVIVMTGIEDEDVALATLREGAQDYLIKNRLSTDNILKSIKYSIERKKFQDLILSGRLQAEEALKRYETELKEISNKKEKLFSIVAQDLKNPFTSLLGSSELLYNSIVGLDRDKISRLAVILNDSARSGYATFQNVIDWSKSQTGLIKYNPVRINLTRLVNQKIESFRQCATAKEIKVISGLDKDVFIVSDIDMIDTILRNLISNAIQFSKRNGTVVVSAKKKKGTFIISVKDTGIGIPEDKINFLFAFDTKYPVASLRKDQGAGLGLKVSRDFVEKMGGKIWVRSKRNRGSIFSFSVPVMNESGYPE